MSNTQQDKRQDDGDLLIQQIRAWRHNRGLYPGWLVAPYQTREKVWTYTRGWLKVAVDAVETWPAVHSILLWRELSWRFGICLQIFPDGVIDLIQKATDDIQNQFVHLSNQEKLGFAASNGWPDSLIPSNIELREDWIECNLVQLGGFRIRPDIHAFQALADTLLNLEFLTQDQRSCVLYHSCLAALSELDRERVSALLEIWPNHPDDPYWLVRKAAVLIELGERESAISSATDALERIRRRKQLSKTDYWKLSREGWCLRFLYQLDSVDRFAKRGKATTQHLDVKAQQRQLDRELEIARCSPDTELRLLEERISKRSPPEMSPFSTYRVLNPPDFDSGWTGQSIRMGGVDPIASLAPAINVLSICDATGVHPQLGNVIFFSDAFKSAMQWIRDEFPGLWFAFALRFGGIGIGKDRDPSGNEKHDAIRRTTLEKLPLDHIQRLFTAAVQESERLVAQAESTERNELTYKSIWTAVQLNDVITRLSLCLEEDEREKIIPIVLKWVRIRAFRSHPSEEKIIRNLTIRVVPYLTARQLSSWTSRFLVEFPLLSDSDNSSARWPEPIEYFPKSKASSLSRRDIKGLHTAVRKLTEHVSSSDIRMRTGAALRLLYAYEWGLLSESERRSFQSALWERTDPQGLPVIDDDNVAKFVHLEWPVDQPERPIEGLRAWILSRSVEDRFLPADGRTADGLPRYSVPWPDRDKFLSSLISLAQHVRNYQDMTTALFSMDCRMHILKNILDWWGRERELFRREAGIYRHLGHDPFERIDLTFRVILDCVLHGNMRERTIGRNILAFVDDVSTLGQLTPFAYPVRAYLQNELQTKCWGELRFAFWNSDPSVACNALIACRQWQYSVNRLALMPMPNDVLRSLLTMLGTHSGPVSYLTYQIVGELIASGELKATTFDPAQLTEAAEIAAFKLSYSQEPRHAVHQVELDREMRTHFRKRLAKLLVIYRKNDISIGPVAANWLEMAKRDCFVDVRDAVNEREDH